MTRGRTRGAHKGPRGERGDLAGKILAAARASFAVHGYAGTSLRRVAREAGVDQALVHYYFSDKPTLLEACLQPPPGFLEDVAAVAREPLERRGEAMVELLMASWEDPTRGPLLQAAIQTAANEPRARERVRAILLERMVGVVAAELGEARGVRAVLCATQMVGLAIVRYVWRVEPLASLPAEVVVRLVAPTIQHYLAGDLGAPIGGKDRTAPAEPN